MRNVGSIPTLAHNFIKYTEYFANKTKHSKYKVREATVGCVAADCNPALKKHRPFDSDRVHQLSNGLQVVRASE